MSQPGVCRGEVCRICRSPAYHKVVEEDVRDGVLQHLQAWHGLSAYLCCGCADKLFGGKHDCISTETRHAS